MKRVAEKTDGVHYVNCFLSQSKLVSFHIPCGWTSGLSFPLSPEGSQLVLMPIMRLIPVLCGVPCVSCVI